MTKNHFFTGAVILAIAGAGAFALLRPKIQTGVCINNLRPIDVETCERLRKEGVLPDYAMVNSVVPLGTPFTNAVAALGGDYTTVRFSDTMYYAQFKCILPGMTNYTFVNFQVESNVVVWTGYIKIRFPAHPSDDSKT